MMKDIVIFTRKDCAYCPMAKKLFDMNKIEYEEQLADGTEYLELSSLYGYNVPLIYNRRTKQGTTGYSVAKLLNLAK